MDAKTKTNFYRVMEENQLAGSCDSILEQELLKENINKQQTQPQGPRIRKPEEEVCEEKGIRGRRKGLYSPKKVPNPPPKPAIAPKPRNIVPSTGNASKSRLPGSPRGTRSTQLRQMTKTRLSSPPSPRITPKSRIRAPLASPANSTISSTSSGSNSSR